MELDDDIKDYDSTVKSTQFSIYIYISDTYSPSGRLLEWIIINYNMYGLICNKYILYNELSNYIRNEVIKFCIGFIIYHEK
jgi:hypothetical protein